MKNLIRASRLLWFASLLLVGLTSAKSQSADSLRPAEDTYSLLTTPTTVMGADVLLRIRSPLVTNTDQTIWRNMYLKFDLSNYTGAIDSVKLRLGAVQIVSYPGGKNRADIYGMDDDSWTGAVLTWNNAPSKGKYLFSQDLVPRTSAQQTTYGDTAYFFNITSFVKSEYAGDKKVSICLTNDSLLGTDARFRSMRATSGILPALMIYRKTTGVEQEAIIAPTRFEMKQNYPNPFNPETRISYSLPNSGYVKVSVYDILGSEIRTIRDGIESAGLKEVVWDARSNNGSQVSSGMYICKIHYQRAISAIKMILMR